MAGGKLKFVCLQMASLALTIRHWDVLRSVAIGVAKRSSTS